MTWARLSEMGIESHDYTGKFVSHDLAHAQSSVAAIVLVVKVLYFGSLSIWK